MFYICTGALQSTKQFCIHLVFDPKNPKEADRATGFISASQMKEMRLREITNLLNFIPKASE